MKFRQLVAAVNSIATLHPTSLDTDVNVVVDQEGCAIDTIKLETADIGEDGVNITLLDK